MGRMGSVGVGVGLVLIVAGCSKPPTKQMEEAEAAITAADNAGAMAYSTNQLMEAQAALAEAQDAIDEGKNSAARKAAILAKTKAEAAQQAIESGKIAMKADIELRLTTIAQELADLKKATPEKNPQKNKERKEKIAETEKYLVDIRTTLAAGNVAEANETLLQAEGSLIEATVNEDDVTTPAAEEEATEPDEE